MQVPPRQPARLARGGPRAWGLLELSRRWLTQALTGACRPHMGVARGLMPPGTTVASSSAAPCTALRVVRLGGTPSLLGDPWSCPRLGLMPSDLVTLAAFRLGLQGVARGHTAWAVVVGGAEHRRGCTWYSHVAPSAWGSPRVWAALALHSCGRAALAALSRPHDQAARGAKLPVAGRARRRRPLGAAGCPSLGGWALSACCGGYLVPGPGPPSETLGVIQGWAALPLRYGAWRRRGVWRLVGRILVAPSRHHHHHHHHHHHRHHHHHHHHHHCRRRRRSRRHHHHHHHHLSNRRLDSPQAVEQVFKGTATSRSEQT